MKELFDNLPKASLNDKLDYLIDTCFFVWALDKGHESELRDFIKKHKCGITSFNAEEFVHIEHKINHGIKARARKFLKDAEGFFLLDLPVSPGNSKAEFDFVGSILPGLNSAEHDHSDAVLLAAAVKVHAKVLSRDRHDIFNAIIENYLKDYSIKVLNNFDD